MYLSPRLSVLLMRDMSNAERSDGHDKFLSTQSENCFSLAYQLSVLGGKITTMGRHGKSFLCRLNRFGWAAFADSRSSDA